MLTKELNQDLNRAGLEIRRISTLFPAYVIYEVETPEEYKSRISQKMTDDISTIFAGTRISIYQFPWRGLGNTEGTTKERFDKWIYDSIENYVARKRHLVVSQDQQDRLVHFGFKVKVIGRDDANYKIVSTTGEDHAKFTITSKALERMDDKEVQSRFEFWIDNFIKDQEHVKGYNRNFE